ncbi:MAG: hypothetical protein IKW83_10735 [Muribaculaceae bacterium]|nr:hypothetical protein [Muribaculaceae bacterium]
MHIFCTKCGKHIDVSLEELENQSGHLVCPQCLAEIDVDVDLFNGNAPAMPSSDYDDITITPDLQEPPKYSKQSAISSASHTGETHQTEYTNTANSTIEQANSHIDDVMRFCKQCGTFLKEGVNFCPKCGKYVRVSPPSFKQPMTAAQQEAAKLRATTQPVRRIPANKQSTYKPPQEPNYQAASVKQQRTPINSVRNGARRRTASSNKNSSWLSKFDILSLGGCITVTVVAVALFFIIYVIIGMVSE